MKKIFNIFLIVFLISFQLKSFAGEKNYHKELITDWSRTVSYTHLTLPTTCSV